MFSLEAGRRKNALLGSIRKEHGYLVEMVEHCLCGGCVTLAIQDIVQFTSVDQAEVQACFLVAGCF